MGLIVLYIHNSKQQTLCNIAFASVRICACIVNLKAIKITCSLVARIASEKIAPPAPVPAYSDFRYDVILPVAFHQLESGKASTDFASRGFASPHVHFGLITLRDQVVL
jgi:hypothetical protein